MLFKRRKKKHFRDEFRNAVWPDMGFARLFRYYGLRIYRLKDTPYAVAAGFSTGVAVSMTPFVGLHFILSAFIARILGGSMVAALIGTLFGNPWTFPIIWYVTYKIGMYVLGIEIVDALPHGFTITSMFKNPEVFFIPMLIGGIPCAIGAWVICFYPMRDIVKRFQKRRDRRRARARLREIKRAQKRAAEQEG